ncbi:hypothetical protein L0E83_15670 [Marichromatium gracile]|uniref:beta strand repeat-containing protein n=1 Tax=Marichromatium gracile TaxID=1048 RepID=UPI001F1DBA50|nr:hypothetical protein [Marichromatium gracile]MCF1184869.1 hypothetical protein [Marichromatium gracile]
MALQTFVQEYYLQQNPDVLQAVLQGVFTSAEQHYTLYGEAEGRQPNPYFEPAGYYTQNPDVLAAVQAGVFSSALEHFEMYGATEGRQPGADTFNEATYLADNPDVQAAVDAGTFTSGYQHFVLYGADEGRASGGSEEPVGQTFRLTEGLDTVNGTAASELIDGSLATTVAGRLQTWNNSDQLDGGAGTDTLFAQLGAVTVTAGSFQNIEILDIEASGAAVVDLNAADGSLTTVKSSNSGANAVTVQNIQSAPTSYVLTNTTGNFTASVANTQLSGSEDAAALDLNNVTAGTVTLQSVAAGSGYETLTVNSNGSVANVLTSLTDGNGNSLTTVNIAGTQDLTLPLADTTVTTVDASGMSGVLNLTVALGNTQNMTITGGTGNDVLGMNGTYTSNDTINGGEGTDRLVLTNAEAIAATTTQSNVTNVEGIQLSDGLNGTVSVNNFGADTLRLGADIAATSTVNFAAGTGNLDFQNFDDAAAGGRNLTATIAGTATDDVLNVTAGSTTAGLTFGASTVTINGAETVNLTSQGGANTFGGAFTLTDTAATEALVITGGQNVTFTGAVRADSIDASGMTGNAALALNGGTGTTATTITGTANADALVGSTAGDIINGGAGADTIVNAVAGTAAAASDVLAGGAGFDTFLLRGDLASSALPAAYSNAAQVTDFTTGTTATTTDILQLTAAVADYSGADAFFAGVATAAAGSTAIQTVAQNAAATAIVTGTDMIKLTQEVTTTGLTAQQAFNTAIGTGSVTGLTAGDDIFVSFYDATNSKMVVGVVDATNGTNTVIESGDTVTIVGSIDMTSADYAAFNANNLSIA